MTPLSSSTGDPGEILLDLWPSGAPGGWHRDEEEEVEEGAVLLVRQVSQPTLEIFPSSSAQPGAPCVLVCPGGGYWIVALEHEGWQIARKLNEQGVHAGVLKYRLPRPDLDLPRHSVPLEDAQEALRLLRSRGAERGWGKTGMMGFSAGGHLTAAAAAAHGERPDFILLIYPAYLTQEPTLSLQPEVQVQPGAPPAFLLHTLDDHIPVEGTLGYTAACRSAQVGAEAHIYPTGGHGYGLASPLPGLSRWPELAAEWIHRQG